MLVLYDVHATTAAARRRRLPRDRAVDPGGLGHDRLRPPAPLARAARAAPTGEQRARTRRGGRERPVVCRAPSDARSRLTHRRRALVPASPPPPRRARRRRAAAPPGDRRRRRRSRLANTASAAVEPGHRLAAPRHARRLADHADQLPRRPPARRSPTSRSSARTAAATAAGSRPTRPAPGESFLPAAPVHARRERHGQRPRQRGLAHRDRPHELHDRLRGARQPGAVPRQAGQRRRRAALPLGAAITPSTVRITTPAAAGATPGRLLPRPLPGHRHARADDRRPGRQPGLVPPAAGRRRRRRTSASSSYDGQTGPDLVAGPHPRARLRPGRGRDLQHLLPAGRASSGPATATTPTCTSSCSPRRAPPGSTPSTRSRSNLTSIGGPRRTRPSTTRSCRRSTSRPAW